MTAVVTPAQPAVRRRRGVALEDAIRAATYAELVEVGYTALTVEGVSARARTGKASIYRRWPTKQELVLDSLCASLPEPPAFVDAVHTVAEDVTTADALRDLARCIVAIADSPVGDVIRAVKCEMATDPELARTVDERFQAPRRAALLRLLERGVVRGEVRPGAVSDLVADVLPALLVHRVIMQGEQITAELAIAIVDQVLLPLIEARLPA